MSLRRRFALRLRLKGPPSQTDLSAISFIGGTIIILTRPSLGIIADRYGAQTAFLIWAVLGVGLLLIAAIYVPQLGNLSLKSKTQPINHELQ